MTDWNETGSIFAPANQEKFEPPAPTPLERLKAWVEDDAAFRLGILTYDAAEWSAELNPTDKSKSFRGYGDTLDAAIMAALAQAEGGR